MGNALNIQQNFNKEQWVEATYNNALFPNVNPYRIKMLMNISTNEVVQEYALHFFGDQDYTEYMRHLDWRRSCQILPNGNNHKLPITPNKIKHVGSSEQQAAISSLSFVYPIEYFIDTSENEFCAVVYSGLAYIKKVEVRLKDINDIPAEDSIYLFYASLRGFGALYEKVGAFQVEEGMIFIDCNGLIKVWMNPNLSKNSPSSVLTNSSHKVQKSRKFAPKSAAQINQYSIPVDNSQQAYHQKKGSKGYQGTEMFIQNMPHSLSQAEMVSNIINLVEDNIDPLTVSSPMFSDYLSGKSLFHRLSFDKALQELQNFQKIVRLKRRYCMLSIADLYRDTCDQSPSRVSQKFQSQSIDILNHEKQIVKVKSRNECSQMSINQILNNQRRENRQLKKSDIQKSSNNEGCYGQQKGRFSEDNIRRSPQISVKLVNSGNCQKSQESLSYSQRKNDTKSAIGYNKDVQHSINMNVNYNMFIPSVAQGKTSANNSNYGNGSSITSNLYHKRQANINHNHHLITNIGQNSHKFVMRINQNPNGFKKPQSFHEQRQRSQIGNYGNPRVEYSTKNGQIKVVNQNVHFARQRQCENPMSKSYHCMGEKEKRSVNINEAKFQVADCPQLKNQYIATKYQNKIQESMNSILTNNIYIDCKKSEKVQNPRNPNLENTIKKPIKTEKGCSPMNQPNFTKNTNNNTQQKVISDHRTTESLQNTKNVLNYNGKSYDYAQSYIKDHKIRQKSATIPINLNYQMPQVGSSVNQGRFSSRNYLANANKRLQEAKHKQKAVCFNNQGSYELDWEIAKDLQKFMQNQNQKY